MNKLSLIVNETSKLVCYTNLEEVLSSQGMPLIAYLEGEFNFFEMLNLLSFPLICAEANARFDFTTIKNLFESELPKNYSLFVKLIGYSNALELLLSNKVFTTQELSHLRLINQICTKEDFEKQVKRISGLSLSAIELVLDLTNRMTYLPNAQAEVLERYAFALRFNHPHQKEGMQAFVEKRPPNFSI